MERKRKKEIKIKYFPIIYSKRTYNVYVHVNKINEKKYFGITKNQVFERWERYGSGYKRGTHIRNAFLKHG